jgi:hypothetical protein
MWIGTRNLKVVVVSPCLDEAEAIGPIVREALAQDVEEVT